MIRDFCKSQKKKWLDLKVNSDQTLFNRRFVVVCLFLAIFNLRGPTSRLEAHQLSTFLLRDSNVIWTACAQFLVQIHVDQYAPYKGHGGKIDHRDVGGQEKSARVEPPPHLGLIAPCLPMPYVNLISPDSKILIICKHLFVGEKMTRRVQPEQTFGLELCWFSKTKQHPVVTFPAETFVGGALADM